MLPPLAAPRRPRWHSQQIFWVLAGLAGLLLLLPPEAEGRAAALFTLGTWVLAAWWFFAAGPLSLPRPFPLGLALLAWAGVQAVSAAAGRDPAASLNAFSAELACLLAFALAWATARNRRTVERTFGWLSLLAAVLALYGVYQHWLGLHETYVRFFAGLGPQNELESEIARRLDSQRAFSLFAYPNTFAGFLDLFWPIALSLALSASRRASRWTWSAVSALLLAGLYASGSMSGGLLALFGGAAVLLLWSHRGGRRPRLEWLGLGGVVLAAGVWFLVQEHGVGSWLADLPGRLANWASAWRMFIDHAVTGVGPGLFGTFFPDYQDPSGFYVRFAHNFILNRLAETGVAGGVVLVWFAFEYGRAWWNGWRSRWPGPRRTLALGLTIGVAAAVLHAAVDVDLHFLKNAAVFWIALGALLGLLTPVHPRRVPVRRALPARSAAAASGGAWLRWGLLGLLTLLLWHGGRSLGGAVVLYGATGLLLGWFWLQRLPAAAAGRPWLTDVPLHEPLGLLFVWGTISAMVSAHPAGAIPGLSLAAAGLLLYVTASRQPGLRGDLWRLLPAAGGVLAGVAIVQAFASPGVRAAAGWPNPNLLAGFLALGLLAWLAWWTHRPRPWPLQVLGAAGTAFGFFGLLATGSLGGLLNLAAGIAVLIFWQRRRGPDRVRALAWQAAWLALLLAVVPTLTHQRLAHPEDLRGQVRERLGMAAAALRMTGERPLTGFGPGNFGDAFERFSFPNVRGLARYGKQAEFAHSEPLQVLAVLGGPGLGLLCWAVWLAVVRFRRQRNAPATGETPADPGARGALWAGLAGAAAQGLMDFNWHLPALWVWGLVMLGAVLAEGERVPEARTSAAGDRPLAPAVVMWLLAAAAVTAAWRPVWSRQLVDLGEAQRYKQNLKASARDFQSALKVHPLSASAYDHLGQAQAEFYAALGTDTWFQLSEWALAKAGSLDGLDPFIHRHLGQLYAQRAVRASGAERQEYLHRAMREYLLAIAQAPHQAFLRFELGNLQREAGYLGDAERTWRQALDLEPNYAAAWSNLGVALEIRGHLPEAESAYRRALALHVLQPDPHNKYELDLLALNWAVVHFNLAHLLEGQGRYAEARGEYASVLAQEPENALARRRWSVLKNLAP
jgi:tetratricopeptide (TPR) repeat protein/O-antigen ligase